MLYEEWVGNYRYTRTEQTKHSRMIVTGLLHSVQGVLKAEGIPPHINMEIELSVSVASMRSGRITAFEFGLGTFLGPSRCLLTWRIGDSFCTLML